MARNYSFASEGEGSPAVVFPTGLYSPKMMSSKATDEGTVIVAGGTGFVGSALIPELLARGYSPIILTRSPKKTLRWGAGIAVGWRNSWRMELKN